MHFAGPVNVAFACVSCVRCVFSQAGSMLELMREAESWRSEFSRIWGTACNKRERPHGRGEQR